MPHIAIKNILKVDDQKFKIVWSDGKEATYSLYDLQKKCPCARCIDEATGERRSSALEPSAEVSAETISSVGSYALKFQFTSGCSAGIYHFALLRSQTLEQATEFS